MLSQNEKYKCQKYIKILKILQINYLLWKNILSNHFVELSLDSEFKNVVPVQLLAVWGSGNVNWWDSQAVEIIYLIVQVSYQDRIPYPHRILFVSPKYKILIDWFIRICTWMFVNTLQKVFTRNIYIYVKLSI